MSDNYQDINMNLLHVMEQEAKQAFERGDKEDGKALCNSIFKQLIPALVKETKKNPEVIYIIFSKPLTFYGIGLSLKVPSPS